MKPFLPLTLLSSLLFLSTFAAPADPVLDSDGNELRPGVEYYVLPSPGTGGGLTLAGRNGSTCPLYVAKETSEVSPGLPVAFFPLDEGEDTVRLTTDANVVFSASTVCVQSTAWRLGGPDGPTGRSYVTTGGVVRNPGRETLSNWFMVEKVGDESSSYKLVFCPQPEVCRDCGRPRCGDLGFFAEDGRAWVGFGGSPFSVMFKKA
uniref:Miraculin n=1 Tax=Anthurium amnicola TaxID=1678845 RepID=A0A1D1YI62_9ARAE